MIEYFSKFYFTVPVQFIITICFVVACVLNYKKLGPLKILLLYAAISLAQAILAIYISVYTEINYQKVQLVQMSISIFTVVELILFYLFILKSISLGKIKACIKILLCLFIAYTGLYWSLTDSFNTTSSFLTLIESYFIVLACLLYYYQLIVSPPILQIPENPTFWVITGMLSLMVFIIPIVLNRRNIFMKDLKIYNNVYLINFIGYIALYIFFILGLRWKIKN
jgi:hypothetical protein